MQRDDRAALQALGLSDEELGKMGLLEPATAAPDKLMEAYLRRSKKREDLATMRQHLRDLVAYAERERLQIRHVWFEQLSASKVYVRRPEFEGATQAVFAGKSKTMAFWKTDRFDRRGMGAVGRMLDEFDRRRARMVSVTEALDSSQTGARIVFAILSERARDEAKDIALRVTTGHAAHKREGRRGTGLPPYGLMSPRLADGKASGLVAHHPEEYPGARRMADLLTGKWEGGERLSGTAAGKRLNAEGYRSRGGKEFGPESVSRIVQSPLFAGLVPLTERVLDEHGNPTGNWKMTLEPLLDDKGDPITCGEGVVTAAEWYQIKAGYRERTGATARGKRPAQYLLSGIARCGRCNGTMRHAVGRQQRDYYRCMSSANKGTCKGLATRATRLEVAVSEAWVLHVTALEPGDKVLRTIARRWLGFSDPGRQAEREHARESLRAAEARAQKLEDDYYVHGKMPEERYDDMSAKLRATIEVMSTKLEALRDDGDMSVLFDAETLREMWQEDAMPLSDRRMLLQSALVSVTVAPSAGRGDRTAIEDRLSYNWIEDQ